LQCAAACCSVLQWISYGTVALSKATLPGRDVLQCHSACCSVLQCVAACCSVSQCVAVCRSVSQCVAVCCSVLQCGAYDAAVLLEDIFTYVRVYSNSLESFFLVAN